MKRNLIPFIALVALVVVCCLVSAPFRSVGNLTNILKQVATTGLIALGMTLVIAGGGIDLSVGSLVALAGVLGINVMNYTMQFTSVWVAFAALVMVCVFVGLLGGALNGFLINYGKIPPFIATLGTFSIFRSLAVYLVEARTVSLSFDSHPYAEVVFPFRAISGEWGGMIPVLIWGVFIGFVFLLARYTKFGWRIMAIGSNEKAAVYSGINVRNVRFFSYVLIGFLCGISTILLTCRLENISSSGAGTGYELDTIAAVIIGGTSMSGGKASIFGAVAGILVLGVIQNALDLFNISSHLQGAVRGVILILMVLTQYKRSRS